MRTRSLGNPVSSLVSTAKIGVLRNLHRRCYRLYLCSPSNSTVAVDVDGGTHGACEEMSSRGRGLN